MPKFIDLTGQRYGKLVVLNREIPHSYPIYWICQCDCGTVKRVKGASLRSGAIQSCGCLKNENLVGQKFNHLTVIELLTERAKNRQKIYKCQCDCGNYTNVRSSDLKTGNTKSCGCYNIQNLSNRAIDLVGQVFGHLTVLGKGAGAVKGIVYWKCQCSCGAIVNVPSRNLREGKTISCGCIKSKGEEKIAEWLLEHKIAFQKEKSFKNFKYEDTLGVPRFDFCIDMQPQILIEYQGIQHYESKSGWNSKENFLERQRKDNIKREWAKNNGFVLYEIPYWEYDNLDNILKNIFNIPNKDTSTAPDMEEAEDVPTN